MCIKSSPKNRNPQLLLFPRGTGLKLAQLRGKTADLATLCVAYVQVNVLRKTNEISKQLHLRHQPSVKVKVNIRARTLEENYITDSYLAAKMCKFVFSKLFRIFAAMNFVSYELRTEISRGFVCVATGTITLFWDVLPF